MTDDEIEAHHDASAAAGPDNPRRRVPQSARCGACNSAEVGALRHFSLGSGSVFRTLADDIYCRRCGYMGQPAYELESATVPQSARDQPRDR